MRLYELLFISLSISYFIYIFSGDPVPSESEELYVEKPYIQSYDCSRGSCDWKKTREDSEVPKHVLEIDEAYVKASDTFDPPLSCLPSTFGYSSKDAAKLFKDKEFRKCNTTSNSFIDFDTSANLLTLHCPQDVLKKSGDSSFKGYYVLGDSVYKERQGPIYFPNNMQPYPGIPVRLTGNEEFAYATCYKSFTEPELAAYKPREKPEVRERVAQQMRDIQRSTNEKYNTNENTKPLTILHLCIDSLSRAHFYRKLPKTAEYLRTLTKHRVFDFKINNVMGNNSPPNLMPWFTGKVGYETRIGHSEDFLGNSSLYHQVREQGFVTMIGTEYCSRFLSWYMGEKINVDHIMASFWCAAARYCGYWVMSEDSRCIAQKYSHQYLLEYTLDFTKQYQGLNQWIFLAFVTAHENTGKVISTMDEHLKDFLEGVLSNDSQEIVLHIDADHGMRYGDWYRLIDGSMEHKLPSLFVICSNSLLERVPGTIDVLDHNSFRLVSKFDLRVSDLHLSRLPYSSQIDPSEYKQWILDTQSNGKAVSIFKEKIPNIRTCYDINIPPFFCSCLDFKSAKIDDFAYDMARDSMWNINYAVKNYRYGQFDICQSISLKEVVKLEVQSLDEDSQNYKMEITINENPKARFEMVVMLSNQPIPFRNLALSFGSYPYFWTSKGYIKLLHVRRLDSYLGMCEDIADFHGVKAEYCVCQQLAGILSSSRSSLRTLLESRYFPIFSKSGKNCFETCAKKSLTCTDNLSFDLYNDCERLGCTECKYTSDPSAPYIENSVCYLYKTQDYLDISRCSLSKFEGQRLCPCLRSVNNN